MATKTGNNKKSVGKIPTDALKRFSTDLKETDKDNLQINRNRVSEFIETPPAIVNSTSKSKELIKSSINSKRTPGVLEYNENKEISGIINLQNKPDFQKSLGPRSRFGEGDGSFFDNWLNSDTLKSKYLFDKDGLPQLRECLKETQTGFKRQIINVKTGEVEKKRFYMKTYAERKEERIRNESKQEDDELSVGKLSITDATTITDYSEFKLPPIESAMKSMTGAEKDNYFGPYARNTFYEYYRILSRQQMNDLIPDLGSHNESGDFKGKEKEKEHNKTLLKQKIDDSNMNTQLLINEDKVESPKSPNLVGDDDSIEDTLSFNDDDDSSYTSLKERSKQAYPSEEEKKLLFNHLKDPKSSSPDRPYSARTTFLRGCTRKGISPQSSWLIRRDINPILNISSLGIGDEVGVLLSAAVGSLPLLEGLYIADNHLTDVSLVPIINNLAQCKYLTSLDLSKNKIDSKAADALQTFLSSDNCNLKVLLMGKANIDDAEAVRFMLAIATRQTIVELDMNSNILGSHEITNPIKGQSQSAGEAIGRLLEDPQCTVQTLKLGWNMIRFKSGVSLVKSLQINKSLTYLDLGFNGLSVDGGLSLGDALHSNQSLQYLNISYNNLTARAAFTIFSGVRSCTTLKNVDISENPIGLAGAKAVLQLNMTEGDRVTVEIKGCSLKIGDPTCWFDSDQVSKEFNLHLNNPYERAVCLELLRLVTHQDMYEIEYYHFKESPDDASAVDLKFVTVTVENDTAQTDVDVTTTSDEILYKIALDMDEARRIYRNKSNHNTMTQFDSDHNDGLDRTELIILLNQLGLVASVPVVNELMKQYDVDNSGIIEEDEFVQFLEDVKYKKDNKDAMINQYRILIPESDTNKKPKKSYIPPNYGVVTIKMQKRKFIPSVLQAAYSSSTSNVNSILRIAKSIADSSAFIDTALQTLLLNFFEAEKFYRILFKDSGSMTGSLSKLLPRMKTPNDSIQLISAVTSNEYRKLFNLKTSLSKFYRIYIGIPNGFYSLNLSESIDHSCMLKLIELSNSCVLKRKTENLGDTSQFGDYSGFRNVSINGVRTVLTPTWLESVPITGKIEFDFILLQSPPINMRELSNQRFIRLMTSLGLISESDAAKVFNNLNVVNDDAKVVCGGSGARKWELTYHGAQGVALHLQTLYESYNIERKPFPTDFIHNEEFVFVGEEHKKVELRHNKKKNEKIKKKKKPHHDNHQNTSIVDPSKVEVYGLHLKNLIVSGEVYDNQLITMRTIDVLETAIAGRLISCAQLEVIISRLSEGTYIIDNFCTLRVELIIRLFTQLSDVINFDIVLKTLSYKEIGILYFRLGLLNIFNPIKAEGAYYLDLSRREERQVVRMLILMQLIEQGDNWINAKYSEVLTLLPPSDSSAPADPDVWSIPETWFSDATLPESGILSLQYFSGKGISYKDCMPNVNIRFSLMPLVLSKPFHDDVFPILFVKNVNLSKTQEATENSGIGFSFGIDSVTT